MVKNENQYEYVVGEPSDAEQIRELLLGESADERDIIPAMFILAKDNGVVVGCARIKVLEDAVFELSSLFVKPEYRGQGMGRSLVSKIISKDHRRPIYLLTMKETIPFYEVNGFTAINPKELPGVLYTDYQRIIKKPFAQGREVVAMVITEEL